MDNIFLNYDSSKLILKNDSTFYLESFGLITPKAVPGWSFGNKLMGKWLQNKNNNSFKLLVGNKKIFYSFYYKIIKLENESLIIGETNEDFSQTFNRIEFVKY